MSSLSSLFARPGVSAKYRSHGVGYGFPVHGYHDVEPGRRPPPPPLGAEKLDAQVTVRVRQFDLSDETQMGEYAGLRDRIANKLYVQLDRRVWTCPDTGKMKIYMEWAEIEYVPPKTVAEPPPTEAVMRPGL